MRQWTIDAFASAPFKGNPACVVEPFDVWPSDAWMQALAHSFGETGAAAVTLVVKALLTPQMREESPEKKFPGYTDVADLGAAIAETVGGAHGNGERVVLGS